MPVDPAVYVPQSHEPPGSFASLPELRAYVPRPSLPSSRLSSPRPAHRYICHDFKGGYSERNDARDYTFHFWHVTDVFIYFSHNRVTCPPTSWIRTAHRHGTRIFGTFIFEWEQGSQDMDLLLGVENQVDFSFADRLVALTRERGFDGWLVNVEVPLKSRTQIKKLLVWLRYFRDQMHSLVPGSEVMWYDAVTVEGQLRWQNTLNDLNRPFLDACDTIFLNYHWGPDEPSKLAERYPADIVDRVVFGIDVYGRGQYGGGRFDTWRALECLERASQTSYGRMANVALFAPGWTVESEHLQINLASLDGFRRWWDDERYMWLDGPETTNTDKMRRVVTEERKVQRGVNRARDIAKALASWPGSQPLPALPRFDYNSELPPLPGHFKSIASFLSTSPQPSTRLPWFTNFSCGSGHRVFLDGKNALAFEQGWTDVDFSFPVADLTSGRSSDLARFNEDDAWLGSRSLEINLTSASPNHWPISSVQIELTEGEDYAFNVVWKSAGDVRIDAFPRVAGLILKGSMTKELLKGWKMTRAFATARQTITLSQVGIHVFSDRPSETTLLLGVISVSRHDGAVPAVIPSTTFDHQTGLLSWTVGARVAEGDLDSNRTDSFVFYVVEHRAIEAESLASVGTSFTTNLMLAIDGVKKLGKGWLRVTGIEATGERGHHLEVAINEDAMK